MRPTCSPISSGWGTRRSPASPPARSGSGSCSPAAGGPRAGPRRGRWGGRARLRAGPPREPLFALVGSYLAGAESEMAATVAAAAIPLIGPLTARPRQDFPLNRYVFYLTPEIT